MKKQLLCIVCGLIAMSSMHGQTAGMNNIQQRIDTAFYVSVRTNQLSSLTDIEHALASNSNPMATYWLSYAKYYEAAYYFQKEDKTASEKAIKEGINNLDGKNNKTSDDYALLAVMQTFSMQFMTNAIRMKFRSNTILKNIDRAIKADGNNVRAYLAAGATDYYTPAEYGGQKKTEGYLKKAISLNSRRAEGEAQPTWGKELSYNLLINFYLDKNNDDAAERYMDEAISLYPKDYGLNELKRQIEQSYGLLRGVVK